MAWNRLGSNKNCIKALGDVFKNNKTLKMLDIAQNQIMSTDADILIESLKENHDLIELRVTGNQLRIDIDCNLYKPLTVKEDRYAMLRTPNNNMLINKNMSAGINKELLRFNWISEKWVPYDVDLDALIPKQDKISEDKVFDIKKFDKTYEK